MRTVAVIVVVLVLVAGGVYVGAGRAAGPTVEIARPARFVGASTPVEIEVGAPLDGLSGLEVRFEQNGNTSPVLTLADATGGAAAVREVDAAHVRITRTMTRETVPGLAAGPGRIVVRATWPVLYGLREVSTETARDVEHVQLSQSERRSSELPFAIRKERRSP